MKATLLPMCLLLAATPATAAPSYPIDPVSLLGLCAEATVIVVAEVDACSEHGGGDRHLRSACARLEPLEVLKGRPGVGALHVAYEAGLICPAPPSYLVGERVLAFLRWDVDEEHFVTCSLSYGTRYPDDVGLEVPTGGGSPSSRRSGPSRTKRCGSGARSSGWSPAPSTRPPWARR